ncbi:hypothetical protein PMAYCL1PPCAC_07498, partial [Pristionchus mayeri]
ICSSVDVSSTTLIDGPPKNEQQIIVTSRLTTQEAFMFANDVRRRMGGNTSIVICKVEKEEFFCFFYPSSTSIHLATLTREEATFNQSWDVKRFVISKNPSFISIIADRPNIFPVLLRLMDGVDEKKLPLLSRILIVSTGSLDHYSDLRSISRFLERRRYERINDGDKSHRWFMKHSY